MKGPVFISYARKDAARVGALAALLTKLRIDVWWDRAIKPGQRFRNAIDDILQKASCVIVVWTEASVGSDWVRSEITAPMERGVLVPIVMGARLRIPRPFTELHHLDLTTWTGRRDASVKPLITVIRALRSRKTYTSGYSGTVVDDAVALERPARAIREVKKLVARLSTMGEVLVSDAAPVRDLRRALSEVDKTYRAVMEAISRFVRPAITKKKSVDPEPFLKLERGVLRTDIEGGRGHCLSILMHYGRADGLRDWLEPKMPKAKLDEIDAVFGRLGTADGDLFADMAEVGQVLTNEARLIVNLLLAGQEAKAWQRIVKGREKLAPLEQAIMTAQKEIGQLKTSLGYSGG